MEGGIGNQRIKFRYVSDPWFKDLCVFVAFSFEKQCVILSTRLSSSSLIYFLNKDLEIYEENLHDIFGIKGELDLSMG